MSNDLGVSAEKRRKNEQINRTWGRFQEAAREALAAGNEVELLLHTVVTQHEAVVDAHDTLFVRQGR
jgi:hypothetical protein